MTYTIGAVALGSDYMSFRGLNDPSVAYPNDAAATNKIAALIGIGYGQRGYGQSNINIRSVGAGDVILATDYSNLHAVMSNISIHTQTTAPLQPVVYQGNVILAEDGSGGRPNLQLLIDNLDSRRFYVDPAELTTTQVLTSQLTIPWYYQTIHEFTVAFSGEDAARFFFNSGGAIQLSANRSDGSSTDINTAMTNLLNNVGIVTMNATSTLSSGTGGTVAAFGFYGLTGSYQTIYTRLAIEGPAPYTDLSYTINARRELYSGLNGGNGSSIRVSVVFYQAYHIEDSPPAETDGTLVSNVTSIRSNNVITQPEPTWTTTIPLSFTPS
jgi:hypothetical protein